jgi:hypothetical protein
MTFHYAIHAWNTSPVYVVRVIEHYLTSCCINAHLAIRSQSLLFPVRAVSSIRCLPCGLVLFVTCHKSKVRLSLPVLCYDDDKSCDCLWMDVSYMRFPVLRVIVLKFLGFANEEDLVSLFGQMLFTVPPLSWATGKKTTHEDDGDNRRSYRTDCL